MWNEKLRALFGKRSLSGAKWSFRQARLTECTEQRRNPARGWYQIHTFAADKEPDLEELKWCLDAEDSLVLVLIHIDSYHEKDLDEECLERIRTILRFFAKRKYDVILRVVYDHEGKAMEREPFFYAQVRKHLEQIGGLLEEFADTVFVYQGMLIGNWGEMHTSRFLRREKLLEMAEVLQTYRTSKTFLAVRRPAQWRMLHPNNPHPSETEGMGLFNDGLFGSDTHLGTFGVQPREEAGWEEGWLRKEELQFVDELCQLVPNGGETVYDEKYHQTLTQESILQELRRLHITYLNKMHDGRLMELWKSWIYQGSGVWAGKSMYDYIGAHLGYRLLVQRVELPAKEITEEDALLEITIQNIGFAAVYQDAECWLEWETPEGKGHREVFGESMKGLKSGGTRKVIGRISLQEGHLYLSARRKRDGAMIWFANPSDEQGRTELGIVKPN